MSLPFVSIIIPAFNQAELLAASIESALAQTHRRLEVVVVDDGSTDGTADVARGFGDPVRYVRQDNAGTAAARNRGIAAARGEVIALLDHDDLFLPRKLELQLPLLSQDGVGLAYTGIEVFDSQTGVVTSTYAPRPEVGVHDLLGFETVPPQTFLFRKRTFDEAGGFDPALTATEDWDFSIRVADRHRVIGLSDPLTRVRTHAGNQGGNTAMMYRRCAAVIRKNRHLHDDCDACRAAVARARRLTSNWYYEHLRDRSLGHLKSGRYARSLAFGVRAGLQRPSKALKAALPGVLRRRMVIPPPER